MYHCTNWTDFAQAIGSLATFGTFIFLICESIKNRKQYKAVADFSISFKEFVKNEKAQQIALFSPAIEFLQLMTSRSPDYYALDFTNKGETARITFIKVDSEKLYLPEQKNIPMNLYQGKTLQIKVFHKQSIEKSTQNRYLVTIEFEDKIKTRYVFKGAFESTIFLSQETERII